MTTTPAQAEEDPEAGRPMCQPEPQQDEASPPPQQMVMQNPDGSMVMLLSPENPYRQAAAQEQGGAAAQPEPQVNVEINPMLLQQLYGPLQLERMARVVRLLALFDMAFSLMHAMADMWPAAIATVMSYSGYLGARLFRRDLTRVYLIYITLFALARVALAVHFFVAPLPGTPARPARPSRYGVAPLITRLFLVFLAAAASSSLPIYLSLTALVQLVIAHFVWRFYRLLPTTIEQARFVHYVAEQHAMMLHREMPV